MKLYSMKPQTNIPPPFSQGGGPEGVHSRRGDLVLVRIADELHFGVVVYVTHFCPWTNSPLKHGTIIGADVPTILSHNRFYFFEPFESA